MKYIYLVLFYFYCLCLNAQDKERLLVFMPKDQQNIQKLIKKSFKENITKISKDQIDLKVVFLDDYDGLPENITSVPAIVYQNHLGYSVYQGRLYDYDRILNHIETSRYLKREKESSYPHDVILTTDGRFKSFIQLKVSEITGTKPKGYKHEDFVKKIKKEVLKVFSDYEVGKDILAFKTDRTFYCDFYPWLDPKGNLYLSGKVFSQFHCKKEIWFTDKKPIVGKYDQFDVAFNALSQKMKVVVMNALKDFSDDKGDAIEAVPNTCPVLSFESLGYGEISIDEKEKISFDGELKLDYEIDKIAKQNCVFQFAAPNEYLSGKMNSISGSISFKEGFSINGMKGAFQVEMNSVNTGDADLNEILSEANFFDSKKKPFASFVFSPAKDETGVLTFGVQNQLEITGNFNLKGIQKELKVNFEIEPVLLKNKLVLKVSSDFKIDISEFGIEGAPGESPNRNVVNINLDLILAGK